MSKEAASDRLHVGVRGSVQRLYGPLLRTLGLAPEEAQVFIDLLSEHQTMHMDLARRHAGDTPTFARLDDELKQQLDGNLRTLLGTDKFAQFSSYRARL